MVLTVNLPEHVQAYIRKQVSEGRFPDVDAVITNAVEQVMEEYRWEEDDDLLEVIASVDRGEVITVTDIGAFLDHLSQEARENSARGVKVNDDIKY